MFQYDRADASTTAITVMQGVAAGSQAVVDGSVTTTLGARPPLLPADGHVRDIQRARRAEDTCEADRLVHSVLRGQLPQHVIRGAQHRRCGHARALNVAGSLTDVTLKTSEPCLLESW